MTARYEWTPQRNLLLVARALAVNYVALWLEQQPWLGQLVK